MRACQLRSLVTGFAAPQVCLPIDRQEARNNFYIFNPLTVTCIFIQRLRDDQTEGLHILGHRTQCRQHDPDVPKKPEKCSRCFHLSQGNMLLLVRATGGSILKRFLSVFPLPRPTSFF